MTLEELSKNVMFFIGAGATNEAGCKTSIQMIDDLFHLIEHEANDDELEIFRFIRSCLEYQEIWKNIESKQNDYITNIEEFVFLLRKIVHRDHIIPHPLVGNWSEKILKFEFKNPKIFNNLLTKIEYTYLPGWLSYDSAKANTLLSPIKQFFTDTSHQHYLFDFFTINYDLVFEKYFNSESEMLVNDGFRSGEWQNAFGNKDEMDKYRIDYHKIHGSLNWTNSLGSEDDTGQVRRADDLPPSSYAPLLIFGQETKMLSIDPFLSLTFRFRELLDERDYIIVIGYSFFDTYINNLILEAVNKYPEKKLIIVSRFSDAPKDCNNKDLAKKVAAKIKRIQVSDRNSNIFNAKQISPDKIEILKMTAGQFYTQFFKDKGAKLIALIKELSKEDAPLA